MANETLMANVEALASVMVAEARLQLNNLSNLVSTIDRFDLALGENSVDVPTVASASAAAVTEGQEVPISQGSAAKVNLKPTSNAAYREFVSDLANSADAGRWGLKFGVKAAEAIVAKWNSDIFALGSGFTNTVGSAGAALTIATIQAGVFKARQQGARGELYLPLTFHAIDDLVSDIRQNSNAHHVSDETISAVYAGEMPRLFGCRIFPIADLTDALENVDNDIIAPLYNRDAIAIAFGADPENGGAPWEVRVETQRVAKQLGFDIVASSVYQVKEINDAHGVGVICRNSA